MSNIKKLSAKKLNQLTKNINEFSLPYAELQKVYDQMKVASSEGLYHTYIITELKYPEYVINELIKEGFNAKSLKDGSTFISWGPVDEVYTRGMRACESCKDCGKYPCKSHSIPFLIP